MRLFLSILLGLVLKIDATTEWFGDQRAHFNPPNNAPFYDVTYDDFDCPEGIQSNAIPEFALFGQMIASRTVSTNLECAQYCLMNKKCKAVNFFQPNKLSEKAYCELLYEDQLENPRLMRPFKNSIYYEKIRCKPTNDDIEYPSTDAAVESNESAVTKGPKIVEDGSSNVKAKLAKHEIEMLLSLKKIASKVHEFNLKFRS